MDKQDIISRNNNVVRNEVEDNKAEDNKVINNKAEVKAHSKEFGKVKMWFCMFFLGVFMYVLAALYVIIKHKGLFFYYGDYNVQQVPFYILAHRAIRNGKTP